MIAVSGLSKSFLDPDGNRVVAVSDVSFSAARGEILGLLGPNGAGKTTTLRMLATLLQPDAGTATLNGHELRGNPEGVRRSIGYLSASTGLYGRLTAREMLLYTARLQGVHSPDKRVEELLVSFDIARFAHVYCDRLSTGMRQKVNIARAVVHDPPILILDEPTSGLDVLVSLELMRFLEESRQKGRCILYSTHIMPEAERLCDRMVVIHQGRALAEGTLASLRAETGKTTLEDAFVALLERSS